MRRLAAVLSLFLICAGAARAAVRCPGTNRRLIFVKSGQEFTLPVQAVPGALDYDLTRAATWSVNSAETWDVHGLMTLQNPWAAAISGRIVFHPTGRSASPDDPGIRYTVEQDGIRAWDDVVAAMGAAGLGSIDIDPDQTEYGNYPLPDVRAPPGGAIVYLAETDNVTNDVSLIIPQQHDTALEQPIVQCGDFCNVMVRRY